MKAGPDQTESASLSIIIPVLNDAVALEALLGQLLQLIGPRDEIIVVDGGSCDRSMAVAQRACVSTIHCISDRGQQLQVGVHQARGEWVWMLHADTVVSQSAIDYLHSARAVGWGRFDISFDDTHFMMRTVAQLMNVRSRQTSICTGDQGIFVHRYLLDLAGGVPAQALMEDIELCKRLRRLCRADCPRKAIVTSSRRWRSQGIMRTVVRMWWLRIRYWAGAAPSRLAREYYG